MEVGIRNMGQQEKISAWAIDKKGKEKEKANFKLGLKVPAHHTLYSCCFSARTSQKLM